MDHLIEVSPSGRAACKQCKTAIAKGELRFGEAFASGFGGGGIGHRYYHLLCAAKKLPWDLADTVAKFTSDIPNRAELDAAIAEGKKKVKPKAAAFPYADRAPTGRAHCISCQAAIEKGTLRVAIEREVDAGGFMTKSAAYLHGRCVRVWLDENIPEEDAIEDFFKRMRENTRGLEAADLDALFAEIG